MIETENSRIERLAALVSAGIAAGVNLGMSELGSDRAKEWAKTIESIEAESRLLVKGGQS